jgi:hypothetical protein
MMEASLVDSLLRPSQFWILLASAAALPGCPPTDDYYVSEAAPSGGQTAMMGTGGTTETGGTTGTAGTTETGGTTGTAGTTEIGGQPPMVIPMPECGNGVAEAAEGCDGTDLRGASCALLGLSAGELGCVNCKFDIAGCAAKAPVCGDGVAEAAEGCDGLDLRDASCEGVGLSGGSLACTAACSFDTAGCINEQSVAVCGDGSAEDAEVCDGLDLRGQTCQGLLGRASGTLRCTTACNFDASNCVTHVPACGDGVAESAESCDGDDLRGYTCEMLGRNEGTLVCTEGCTFDTDGCGMTGTGCDGQGGAGGEGSTCCMPAAEICDGRSNDCDEEVDEGEVCPEGCTAQVHDDRLYLLCIHSQAAAQRAYADASADCAAASTELGLDTLMALARIESAAENDFLKTWIEERVASSPTDGIIWHGANDIARENRWVWGQGMGAVHFFQAEPRGGGTAVMGRFNDFPPGRPNSANDTDEDCGGFDTEADWRWNDRLCTQRALGFVCEQIEAPEAPPEPDPTDPMNP